MQRVNLERVNEAIAATLEGNEAFLVRYGAHSYEEIVRDFVDRSPLDGLKVTQPLQTGKMGVFTIAVVDHKTNSVHWTQFVGDMAAGDTITPFEITLRQ